MALFHLIRLGIQLTQLWTSRKIGLRGKIDIRKDASPMRGIDNIHIHIYSFTPLEKEILLLIIVIILWNNFFLPPPPCRLFIVSLFLFPSKNNCIKKSQSESKIANLGTKVSSRFPNRELGTFTRGFGGWVFALHKELCRFKVHGLALHSTHIEHVRALVFHCRICTHYPQT